MAGKLLLVLAVAGATAAGTQAQSDQQCYDINWTTLARSGLKYGTGQWGASKSQSFKDLLQVVPAASALPAVPLDTLAVQGGDATKDYKAPEGFKLTNAISAAPDVPTFHTPEGGNGTTYIINHFEYPQPSTLYISEVAKADDKGNLKIVNTRAVPDAQLDGLWFMCSGTITPWGTHFGAEEYPIDCRSYEEVFVPCKAGPDAAKTVCGLAKMEDDATGTQEFARYYGYYSNYTKYGLASVDILNNQPAHDAFVKLFKCYNYGSSPEIKVLPGGKTQITKWRTLGRMSHESALVMPDNKTVYTTDDFPNGVFLKFVADKAGDMSAGTLYAAKFSGQRNDSSSGKPEWDVTWVELGKGDQATLDKMATAAPGQGELRFSDIFEAAHPSGSPPKCPEGFDAANTYNPIYVHTDNSTGEKYYMECLKINKGMETAAAFFETRRVAAMKGASTEFEKQEGITFSKARRQVYFATTRISKGMTADKQYNYASADAISLAENKCGAIFSMDLDDSWSGISAKTILEGNKLANTDADNKCNTDGIADPDNLHYVAGNLLIQEDTANHLNNVLWAFNLDDGTLTRILSSPKLAEVSGIWANMVGDKAYLSMAIQHPEEGIPENGVLTPEQVEAQRAYMGYIGPLPTSILSDKFVLNFTGIPLATGADTTKVISTQKVCVRPAPTTNKVALAPAKATAPAATNTAAKAVPVVSSATKAAPAAPNAKTTHAGTATKKP